MYTFVKTRLTKTPSVMGWYLIVKREDTDLILGLHRVVSHNLWLNRNPHAKEDDPLMGPAILGGGWLTSAEKMLFSYGEMLVNCRGGIMPPGGYDIIERVQSKSLKWPGKHEEEEIITILKWGGGNHCYLKSNTGRLFSREKFSTLGKAEEEAVQYVPRKSIKRSFSSGYRHEGD